MAQKRRSYIVKCCGSDSCIPRGTRTRGNETDEEYVVIDYKTVFIHMAYGWHNFYRMKKVEKRVLQKRQLQLVVVVVRLLRPPKVVEAAKQQQRPEETLLQQEAILQQQVR